jgi:hypothetical protein
MTKQRGFDLRLERYLLGELPAAEMAAMEKELAKSAAKRRALEELKQETEQYYRAHPRLQGRTVAAPEEVEPWFRRLFSPRVIGGLAFAAACIAAVLYFPKGNPEKDNGQIAGKQENNLIAMNGTNSENSENTVRTKGLQPALFLSVIRGAGAIQLNDGDQVQSSDEIQISYRASGNRYGIIVSVDAEKSVSLHFPASVNAAQELKKGAQVKIPTAFKLDEKPGFERFFFFAAEKPLPLKKIMAELAKTGKIGKHFQKDIKITSINLKKA